MCKVRQRVKPIASHSKQEGIVKVLLLVFDGGPVSVVDVEFLVEVDGEYSVFAHLAKDWELKQISYLFTKR